MSLLLLMLLCQAMLTEGNYTYAPVPKALDGSPSLACVGISYNNPINDYVTAARCKKGADGVANFYLTNSRGLLKIKALGYHMNYNGGAAASFSKAELVAKKNFKASHYVIPSIFRNGGNHASNNIAHVVQMTGWVWNHEVGHLLGLQHTGRFVYSAKGVPTYNSYGDQDSVMGGGGVGSKYLTAPQYYMKGWLPQKEAALYVSGTVYELKQITNFDGKGLSVVVIPNSLFSKSVSNPGMVNGRAAYVAYPKTCGIGQCIAIYLAGSGASARVGSSNVEFFDTHFTGIHIRVVNVTKTTVNVTIDFLKPPAGRLRVLQDELPDDGPVEYDSVEYEAVKELSDDGEL